MKLLEIEWNCILSPIIFLINLPSMFKSTIGQKDLGELYNVLLGFGIIINVNILKWEDQYPMFMQALAILIIEIKHELLLINCLRIFHKILSSPDIDKLLHFEIIVLNSSFKKESHSIISLAWISSKILILIW